MQFTRACGRSFLLGEISTRGSIQLAPRRLPRQALNKFWPAEKDNQHDARSNEVQYSDDPWS